MKSLLALLIAATVADADDKLTPKEIAEGWVLLFDGETTFGLKTSGGVTVEDGKLAIQKGSVEFSGFAPGTLRRNGEESEISGHSIGIAAGPDKSFNTLLAYKPGKMQPLFNGKDLTGWKLFEGDPKKRASKYDVTKDGELHVTNGPGDLQTEKQYENFLLQFDCKTNGTALNSGIFFRCRPNEYQNGYEAQIQNAYKDNDRTKPADFGTGAIYRRVPARKVVSNDNEWFTMTVLAQGPNIRTWVNGYPTVNWTDDRKPTDNARTGLYLKPGHLSIQGHDPTTDILFRNIKIVELK